MCRSKTSRQYPAVLSRLLMLLPLSLLLSACASLSKEECQQADWRTIGYEDGLRGYQSVRISEHRKACADHGVTPDLNAYSQGRDSGLQQYCKPRNGFVLGQNGAGYGSVCPPDAEQAFLPAYKQGREIYSAQKHLNSLNRLLDSKEAERQGLIESVELTAAELVSSGVPTARRVQLLLDLREMEQSVKQLNAEIPAIERDLFDQGERLENLRANASHW